MARNKKPDLDDAALLEKAFKDVEPLEGRKVGKRGVLPNQKPKPRKAILSRKAPTPDLKRPKHKPLPELKHGSAPGVDKRTTHRFKKGRLGVEGRLDLHGHTQAEAYGALSSFLELAQSSGKRCVLIVTGKGGQLTQDAESGLDRATGVLKDMTPRWLNQMPNRARVLSFTHARPEDGGSGALYVLLKKRVRQ